MSPTHGASALSARFLVGAALVSATVLGGAPTAFAQTFAAPKASGDNGTVKIHNPSTPEEDNRNEPKVCDFEIVADNFDAVQEVSWEILTHGGGNAGEVALEGDLVLDGDGSGSTEVLGLDEGQYKLDWTFEGQKSNDAKHKVFKVLCEETEKEPEQVPGPGEEPSTPPGEEESPVEEPSDESTDPAAPEETDEQVDPVDPTDPADVTDPADPAGPEVPETGDEKSPVADDSSSSLPVTGSALAGLAAAGIVAVAGGGAAVYFGRRRKSTDSQE